MSDNLALSYSSYSNYTACPRKYKLNKVDKLSPKRHSSAFVFGKAVDEALNRMLGDKMEGRKIAPLATYLLTFDRHFMKAKISGADVRLNENEIIDFKKTDFDDGFLTEKDRLRAKSDSHLTWLSMRRKGHRCIELYMNELLPKIKTVLAIQKKVEMVDEKGDSLIGFVDLICELHDGETYIIDNKTSAKRYTESQANNATQLVNYAIHLGINNVGYFVMTKTKKPEAQIVLGTVTERAKDMLLEGLVATIDMIKGEHFPPNTASCGDFGGCEYYNKCHYGIDSDLFKREDKK